MVTLTEYLNLPRSQRTLHIDLSSPCQPSNRVSVPPKSPLLDFLSVFDDIGDWRKHGIQRCHACEMDSTRGWCVNPLHIYIGTVSENMMDKSPTIRSQMAANAGRKAHSIKDENGKSINAKKSAAIIHSKKDADGKSIVAKKAGKSKSKPVIVSDTEYGVDWIFPSSAEVERTIGICRSVLSSLTRNKKSSHKNFEVKLYGDRTP